MALAALSRRPYPKAKDHRRSIGGLRGWQQKRPLMSAIPAKDEFALPLTGSVLVADPIGSGFVTMLPRPGGNITGSAGVAFLRLLIHAAPSPCGARQLPP